MAEEEHGQRARDLAVSIVHYLSEQVRSVGFDREMDENLLAAGICSNFSECCVPSHRNTDDYRRNILEQEAKLSFCPCIRKPENRGTGMRLSCSCGEDRNVHEWAWDTSTATSATLFSDDNREVLFHPHYSNGTAVIRGNMPCVFGNEYYWEIKILTALYGTDFMIGVGTSSVDISKYAEDFCSLLGDDAESWGYSFKGIIQNKTQRRRYTSAFGQGSIIGVHLDMWNGTLQFYLNRKPLGMAFRNLLGHTVYPMICSTTAKSIMRVTYSTSTPSNLQLLCIKVIRSSPKVLARLKRIPLLRSLIQNQYWWMVPSRETGGDRDEMFNDSSELDANLVMCFDMIDEEGKLDVGSSSDEDKENATTVKKRRIATLASLSTSASRHFSDVSENNGHGGRPSRPVRRCRKTN